MTLARAAVLALLLAAPAAAQDAAADMEERMNACFAGIDVDAIGSRADSFAAARSYEARVAELCAAGDPVGAKAFAKEVEADFYAQDAEAARMRACVAEVLGEEELDAGDVCDQ